MPAQARSALLVRVRGVVQGVGFRPFVWRLAGELGLSGWVRNDAEGVLIRVEGESDALARLLMRLEAETPPLARIDHVESVRVGPENADGFSIVESAAGRVTTAIGHDTAPCPACLAEMFDPAGRRWRHAFITCTHCGPRYTVTRRLPYDRAQTSLAPFPLCPRCLVEYKDPADRRFHAETTCCPACGPTLALLDSAGLPLAGDPVTGAVDLLRRGGILALKGMGGFQLLCDARNSVAVAELRKRKDREEKPFALLFANSASVSGVVSLADWERILLEASERPIVLLRKEQAADASFSGCAPGLAWLGAMLPATPLHYLLFHEAAARPSGLAWLEEPQSLVLVCTSANPGGEPLVVGNREAMARLAGLADGYLLHDRDIVVRCDDSVVRSVPEDQGAENGRFQAGKLPAGAGFSFVRRARGYTPRAIRLPHSGPSVLALGGWYKNTICVTRGDQAFLSQHIGDLDNRATCLYLEETVEHLLGILDVTPDVVAHDLHPDFHSSRYAVSFAAGRGIPAFPVQHHHAHVAAVLAERGHAGPALGVALDGVGLGADGQAWGGELLRLEGAGCTRLGRLAPLRLPGGDRAAREPWRMAAAALYRLGRGDEIPGRFPRQPASAMMTRMLDGGINCPESSSMGRLFDAAAGLLGVREVAAFEGQAAMLLEGLAERESWPAPLSGGWRLSDGVLDFARLLAAMADSRGNPARAAALFHATVVAGLGDWILTAARQESLDVVALGGGCFLNRLLGARLPSLLGEAGLRVLTGRQAPANDGGLALGQAWLAMGSHHRQAHVG